jgi:predicted short-subunit dehydrogenase-like oxidoreductase (DUF2520 family)
MVRKPRIVIVGAGNFGSALAVSLFEAGYRIEAIIARRAGNSLRKARALADRVDAVASVSSATEILTDVVWFAVPDSEIARAAQALAMSGGWARKVALHSSGALASDELNALRRGGTAVASVHPLMTFVRGSQASLAEVPFAIEGDVAAVRMARTIVKDVGGASYAIRKRDKAAYHAWGMLASPLLDALLATNEEVAALAGISPKLARQRVVPILLQTLANYSALGPGGAFSGPIVRGDAAIVKKHLDILRSRPQARGVYSALAKAALSYLPVKKRKDLKKLLQT